jgi:hypothetical protein
MRLFNRCPHMAIRAIHYALDILCPLIGVPPIVWDAP